jgi:hypothetical protein
MVIDFAQRISRFRKELRFFLKLQETESSLQNGLRVIILNPFCNFMQLPNNKKFILHPISILAPTPELSFPENKNRGS